MARKSAHPDRQLFDFLSGTLDEKTAQMIREHLANCVDCASVADLAHALKEKGRDWQISTPESQRSQPHPAVSELASFFYDKSPRARNSATAAHVALCRSCADELALYAQSERAASLYDSSQAEVGEVPARAWEMILDWEESSFARPKPESDAASSEQLAKLSQMLSERKDDLRGRAREALGRGVILTGKLTRSEADANRPDLVPVIVVDRTGQFRGVEMFEKATGERGASILKHAEKSSRFDNKQFQALLDFGEKSFVVVSDLIRRDTIRLQHVARPNAELRRADYFIIED